MQQTVVMPPNTDAQRESHSARKGALSEKTGIKTATVKEIETFGNDMLGQHVQMMCEFREVSNTWVRLLLRDESYIGFDVRDVNGDLFQFAFASKATYGRDLLKLKRGDRIRLIGEIKRVENEFVLIADEISW